MGLGVFIDAPIEARGLLRRRPAPREVAAALEEAFRASVGDPLLAEHARFVRVDDALDVHLHPATGPIEVRVERDRITCEATTSAAGPGYHAYVVELLEQVGERARLPWCWDGDECGFRDARDLGAVQAEMLGWLRALCGVVVDDAPAGMQLCLPVGYQPITDARVVSQLGPLPWEWVEAVARADGDALADLGRTFFPWWDRPLDAAFWDGYGRALAWIDLPWHAALDDADASLYDAALAAFDRARALDGARALPSREIDEMRRLRGDGADPTTPPAADGIGYRRGPMRWPAGGWTMRGPGYWYESVDDGTIARWFGDRTVHATAFEADGPADELLASGRRRAGDADPTDVVTWEDGDVRAIGVVARDGDGGHWNLHGYAAADGALLIATFAYEDDADRAWAEETFRSISR